MPAKPARNDNHLPIRTVRRHYRAWDCEMRKAEPDGSYFEGHCAVLHSIDEYGTIMGQGCFDQDLPYFKANGFFGGLNHNWSMPIGKPAIAEVDTKGLYVGGYILDTTHGADVRKLLAAGVVNKLSFGFDDLAKRWLDKEADVRAYWKDCGYEPRAQDEERARAGALLFTRVKVYEASPVMVPGNQLAEITEVRGAPAVRRVGERWCVFDDAGVQLSDHDEPEQAANAAVEHCRDFRRCQGRYLTLENHVLAVHAAVEELCDRFIQLAALRASGGRALSPERGAALRRIRDRVESALTACQPAADPSTVARLRRELLQLERSILSL